jgi:dipeptidyl aminopeptidase/acylaminoacyl peptidase
MLHQASMLNKAGYSVMLLDLRAHGKSEEDTVTGRWETDDVLSALEFLESYPDVDANEVGVWGIAFGAQVALQAAAKSKAIRALVLESMSLQLPRTVVSCRINLYKE